MSDQRTASDPFASFWNEFMTRVGVDPSSAAGTATAPAFGDAAKQMQRIFFDTMAKYAEDFMRSEQFLSALKQTMDQSLQMKKMFDEFLVNAQRGIQSPVRGDIDDIAGLMRSVENRVLKRLDALEEKVAAVEDSSRVGRAVRPGPTKRSSVTGARTNRKSPPKNRRK